MNNPNEKQHFVSEVLLKRFKIPGQPLQCYQVRTGQWIPKNPSNACSFPGYSQILRHGQDTVENTIEAELSAIESRLPKAFKALEDAAKVPTTELCPQIYENICKYCAYLKLMAPHSKPGAVVSFVIQVNMELQSGGNFLSNVLKLPVEKIAFLRQQYALGQRVIVEAENALQLFYKFQFQRNRFLDCDQFLKTHWTVFNSRIELPISDVGLVPIGFTDLRLNVYLLPIAPNLVLKGLFYYDLNRNSSKPVVKGLTLNPDEAEYVFDCICSSAIIEVASSRANQDVPIGISRAKAKGIRFHKVQNTGDILSAGLKAVSDEFQFRLVSAEEYKRFVHSYMQPAEV